jgi:hypothetical protein
MRVAKPVELDHISQVLAKGACPICAFLKNDQASLLRGELQPDQVTGLCNFHAWALAAAGDRNSVAQTFLRVLHHELSTNGDPVDRCSVCSHLVQREVIHMKKLIEQMNGGLVLDWMKREGTFCRLHATHLRQLAPSRLQPAIDEIVERSTRALEVDLENLLRRTEAGKGIGGGALGRAAEFLVSQRGIGR